MDEAQMQTAIEHLCTIIDNDGLLQQLSLEELETLFESALEQYKDSAIEDFNESLESK